MNCHRARKLIFDLIDDAVDEASKLELEQHLGACEDCESLANGLNGSLDLLRHAPVENPDENFNWKVRLAIHKESAAIRGRMVSQGLAIRSWNLRFAVSAAAGFAAILAGGWMGVNVWMSRMPAVTSPVKSTARVQTMAAGESKLSTRVAQRSRPRPASPIPSDIPGRMNAGRTVSLGTSATGLVTRRVGAIDRVADATPLDSLVRDALKVLPAGRQEEYLQRRIDLLNEYLERCRAGQRPSANPAKHPLRP